MIKYRELKAQKAFFKALESPQANYADAVLDNLAPEIEKLGMEFKKSNIPLAIRGFWVENDLSFVVVLEEGVKNQEAAPFLKLQFNPITFIKAQVLEAVGKSVKAKLYHHLDKDNCVERLIDDVRNSIIKATPQNLKADVEAVFVGLSPKDQEFKDHRVFQTTLVDKYCTDALLAETQPDLAKKRSEAAYTLALHYQ